MPILPAFFRPKGSGFGLQLITTDVAIGTGGTTIAGTATTSVTVPKPAGYVAQLIAIEIQAFVAAVPASGDMLAQVFKRDNSGTPANRTLTGTKSLTSSVVATADKTYTFAITATSAANLTFQSTDTCRVDVVTTDAVTTQPTARLVCTWAVVRSTT